MKSIAVVGCAAIALAVSVPAAAQPSRATRDAKYRVETMERILEGAAAHGAKGAQERFKTMLPGDFLLADEVRVRGFMIGDWGVFFDVQMPPLESTTPWIVRTLDQNDLDVANAMRNLRSIAAAINDPAARQTNLQSVERIELQLGLNTHRTDVPADNPQTANGQVVNTQASQSQGGRAVETASFVGDPSTAKVAGPTSRPVAAPVTLPDDPQTAFHAEVKAATIEAMLEHGASLKLKPEQRLMVAIRGADNLPRLAPGEPESPTIQITISGADLIAASSNQLTHDEVLKRVVIEEVP
jgi:hypothetical protein